MKTLKTRLLVSVTLLALAWITSSAAQAAVTSAAIGEAIAQTCRAELALPSSSRIEVHKVKAAQPELMKQARSIARIELPPGEGGRGLVTARVHLNVPGQKDAWTWASARTRITVPTVITRRPVRRGTRLQADDLMITQMPENPSHIQDIDLAVGRVVRRNLSRHKAVKASAIRKPDMIRRGDRLEAVIRRAGMKIRTSAIAVESGGDRDMVRVKLASNGRVLTGRIMNARQVEVTP